jgi:hypothetical protein
MKTTALVLGLGLAVLLAGCNSPPAAGGATDKRIAELEKQVGALKDQNRDIRAKSRIASQFGGFRSPLENFFAAPEFWECTYDSSWSDCSSRCAKTAADGHKICDGKPAGEQQSCHQGVTDTAATCVQNCPVQMSPTNPPSCSGGGGPA